MAATLLLDNMTWDLCADLEGNIAVATEPYSVAQDAASAIRTFIGEVYYSKTLGVPYFQQILGQAPPLALLKARFIEAALTVPTVVSAKVFITSFKDREIKGQVQVVDVNGELSAASF